MQRMLASALFACVRFGGLPDMAPESGAGNPSAYASERLHWSKSVFNARIQVRSKNISWMLTGTEGEQLASAEELRERFGGVIFVGDSQIREIAWAGYQMLTTGRQEPRFSPKSSVARHPNLHPATRTVCRRH